jgi:hypothetical protein
MTIAEEFSQDTFPEQKDSQMYANAPTSVYLHLTSFLADSRARTSASQISSATDSPESEALSGLNTSDSFASYDRDSSSWRTSQQSLFPSGMTPEGSQSQHQLVECLETWPRSGITLNGIAFQRQPLVRSTSVTEFSSSRPNLPTPTACDHKGSGRLRLERGPNNNLRDYFKIKYGFLYPPVRVVEWLMGYWTEHTALRLSETPSSPK